MHTHGWGHIHIGPWLRNEQSKRFYYFFFKPNTNFCGFAIRRLANKWGRHKIILEPDLRLAQDLELATYVYAKVPSKTDYFIDLRGSEDFLRKELLSTLRSKHQTTVKNFEAYPIALHVRRGDFSQGGRTLTSEEYFIDVAKKLQQKAGKHLEIRVFSDARPDEIAKLLALPNVSMATPKPDVIELFEMSKAKIIVTSLGSTFGYWAAFLSTADVILDTRHEFGKIRCAEIDRHYEGGIDQFLSLNDDTGNLW